MSDRVVESVAIWLASQSTLAAGVSVFAHQLPESTGNPNVSTSSPTVGVFETVGPSPIETFVPSSGGQPSFNRHRVEVVCRSTGDDAGDPLPLPSRQIVQTCYRAVCGFPPNSTVPGGYGGLMTMSAETSPALIERDASGRYVWRFVALVYSQST